MRDVVCNGFYFDNSGSAPARWPPSAVTLCRDGDRSLPFSNLRSLPSLSVRSLNPLTGTFSPSVYGAGNDWGWVPFPWAPPFLFRLHPRRLDCENAISIPDSSLFLTTTVFSTRNLLLSRYVCARLGCQNIFRPPELTARHLDRARGVFSIKVRAAVVRAIAQVTGGHCGRSGTPQI